ncbi:MAG: hypothetical protein A2235_00910 [Deltaproteobacteria bacterium RIFOXYA2_FULL_42_10]|nr:MAG: hypothetical protein A2090_09085 [Deltaproteobacteria bacterium GWD2_42_10]OGQ26176.1 MAG: hypothetical protein A3D29_06090 [Deltaproteobacteria bacterium RIFCSPHIGHO2_02_FULL_42_44]OGQ72439.1 MAG: hypothetical protein A2235_00910 [Deltaproteobacteria bacterium RIFOXYA2_FULL_42_10]
MNKENILSEIRRIASENDGKAPGMKRFVTETGISKSDWYPKLWLRWSDAIKEAGCEPNTFGTSFDNESIIRKYIDLIRELGHFPIQGEIENKRKEDIDFPSSSALYNFGSKQERIKKIIEYCKGKNEFDDIIHYCSLVDKTACEKLDVSNNTDSNEIGYVYIVQHGTRNEYKIGRTINPIRREGEVQLQLPEKLKPIHYIKTDDPAGIENYWHTRFAIKRKEGEWFSLTAKDIRAFKRWRKIF